MAKITSEKIWEMFEAAEKSMRTPYAKKAKRVFGAAVLGGSGSVYSGCNIESYPINYCAERVALLKALSEGEKEIGALLCTWNGKHRDRQKIGGICGTCLNAFYQLTGKNLKLPIYYWPTDEEDPEKTILGKLYPEPF